MPQEDTPRPDTGATIEDATSVATLVPALSVHERRAYALTRELARRVQTTEVIAAVSLLAGMIRREQALRERVERLQHHRRGPGSMTDPECELCGGPYADAVAEDEDTEDRYDVHHRCAEAIEVNETCDECHLMSEHAEGCSRFLSEGDGS